MENYLSPLIVALISLAGFLMNWGAFKTRLDNHDKKLEKIDEDQDRQDKEISINATGLARLEGSRGWRK